MQQGAHHFRVSHLEPRHTWAMEDISAVNLSSLSFKETQQRFLRSARVWGTSLQLDNTHGNQATQLLFVQAGCCVNQSRILEWCLKRGKNQFCGQTSYLSPLLCPYKQHKHLAMPISTKSKVWLFLLQSKQLFSSLKNHVRKLESAIIPLWASANSSKPCPDQSQKVDQFPFEET